MDMDSSHFQTSFMGPYCGGFPPVPKVENMPFSTGGLARYHSAPSSMIAGLLDDDFSIDTDNSEMSQLLNDGIGSFASLLDTRAAQQAEKAQALANLQQRRKKKQLSAHERKSGAQRALYVNKSRDHPTQSPLSSISEHAVEDQVDDYDCTSRSRLKITTTGIPAIQQTNLQSSTSCDSGVFTMDSSSSSHPRLLQSNPGLMRHSSSPADFLSRLVMEEANERSVMNFGEEVKRQQYPVLNTSGKKATSQGFGISAMEDKPMGQSFGMPAMEEKPVVQSFGLPSVVDNRPSLMSMTENLPTDAAKFNELMPPVRPGGLLRQSSSPVGLLSQISMEELTSPSSSGSSGRWDELSVFGQRKRGRGVDDYFLKNQQRSPTNVSISPQSSLSPTMSAAPSSFDDYEGSTMDSVLCKARAKRGYATHPRSIAERVRRTKISERIKKLQDLVPNLDKQANTSDMLDEVVEYVKSLQLKIQELSLLRPMCNCAQQEHGKPH